MDNKEIFWSSVVILLALIVLGKYIYAWYSEIKKRNRYMKAQIRLLAQIAAASGVSKDLIAEIVAESELPGE